jgi:hypothetical protein
MNKVFHDSITVLKEYHCKECGWPVIDVCCNWGICPDGEMWDYWQYCSNKMCKNHVGEGVHQFELEWIEKD